MNTEVLSAGRAQSIAFLTAFATLFCQVLVHRMVSAKLVNNLAFLVISLTMLGFAASAVVLVRFMPRLQARQRETISASASLFVLTLLAGSVAFYHSPAGSQLAMGRWDYVVDLLTRLPWALLFSVPFACCGLILGLLLSSPNLPTRRIYFADLVGSAVGAFAVVPAISWFGVEWSALGAGAILLVGVFSLARPSGGLHLGIASVAAASLVFVAAWREDAFSMRYPPGSVLALASEPGSGVTLERIAWDPVARIEISRIPPPDPERVAWPSLLGRNPSFVGRFKRVLTQNNNAFTYAVEYDGRRESLAGIEETIYAAAYEASSAIQPRVLVVGVGGGFDILNALFYGAREITGIEVNGATVDILTRSHRDYFRAWLEDPRVRLVHAEGRHFLDQDTQRYDILQLSGVDSASGTAGAAHVFSELYLYTAEAFDTFLSRVTDSGILCVMRQEWIPPRHMLRVLTGAVESLRRSGVEHPSQHIVMVSSTDGLLWSMLVKKAPFTNEDVARIEAWTKRSPLLRLSAGPGRNAAGENAFQAFLSLESAAKERLFARVYPFDIRPIDDDRPFFFRHSYWWHVWSDHPVILGSIPVTELGLITLLAITGAAAFICVYLPLRWMGGGSSKALGAGRGVVFFGGIGIGYMAVEIAVLQKFGLLLGHPNYALSCVLASLLLASGIGSLLSEAIVTRLRNVRFVAYLLALVILLEHSIILPHLSSLVGLPFWARVSVVLALVMPLGLLMGVFFPWALERLRASAPLFVPWAWGVNGIASVVAPILSVAISMTWGMNALLVASVPVYLVAAFAVSLRRPPFATPEPARDSG